MTLLLQGTTRLHSLSRHLRGVRPFNPSRLQLTFRQSRSMNESIVLSGRVVKEPEGRSRQSERRTATTFTKHPQKFGWCAPDSPETFIYTSSPQLSPFMSQQGYNGRWFGWVSEQDWGTSQHLQRLFTKNAFPSSLTRLPPELDGF